MAVIQVGEQWQFGSEYDLEEVVWQNLTPLLNLSPFKRQFCVRGQFCDILALDDQQRLVVIELKNTEDRYVVQQLTRYYDALRAEAPFGPEINGAFIRLVAIAPGFHPDTLIDCKYNRLELELICFHVQPEPDVDSFSIQLRNSEGQTLASLPLAKPPTAPQTDIQVSDPLRKLLNLLSYSSEEKFNAVISFRRQILQFDERMKEIIEPQWTLYGRSKSKPCAEIRRVKANNSSRNVPLLFLWLPDPSGKSQVLRLMIDLDQTGTMVSRLMYCPRNLETREWWNLPGFTRIGTYTPIPELYKPFLDGEMNCSLSNLIELALKTWQARL